MTPSEREMAVRTEMLRSRRDLTRHTSRGPGCFRCRHQHSGICRHPVMTSYESTAALNRLQERQEVTIEQARSDDGLCGPEALLFEAWPLKLKLAYLAGTGWVASVAAAWWWL